MAVDGVKREPSRKEIIVFIASKRPWLIPILYTLYSAGSADIQELKEILGVRSTIVKRGLWWLTKYGVVEKSGEKYIVSKDYRPILDEMFLDMCRTRHYYILRFGATYLVIVVKKTRITSYTVPVKLVNELARMEENVGTQFTVIDFAQAANIPPKLASRVVRVRRLLLECKKQ